MRLVRRLKAWVQPILDIGTDVCTLRLIDRFRAELKFTVKPTSLVSRVVKEFADRNRLQVEALTPYNSGGTRIDMTDSLEEAGINDKDVIILKIVSIAG